MLKVLLEQSCQAYAQEKNYWLDILKSWKYQAKLKLPRQIRDEAMKSHYQPKYGLQGRQWKLALQDAAETWDKYLQALFVEVRKKISRHIQEEEARHYAFWLLKGYEQFSACMQGQSPTPPFSIEMKVQHQIASYVERTVRKLRGNFPVVKKKNSIKLDANCYKVFDHKGKQYIKVMSLQKGKRITLSLLGRSHIQGNISLHCVPPVSLREF